MISRLRLTEMAPKKDVPWWINIVGAISATPVLNVFLHGLATLVLAPLDFLVPPVVKVSSNVF